MLSEDNLHPYQLRAVDFIIAHRSCALFLPMGMGKTISTITAVRRLQRYIEVKTVLVIAPLRVARDTWASECDKWEHTSSLRLSVVVGDKETRAEAMRRNAEIFITNREQVQWLFETYPDFRPEVIVVDELSSFKNPQSKRFKALAKYLKNHPDTRVVGLTGTPAPNGLMDLWAEMYLIDQGERLYPSITKYREVFFTPGRKNGFVVYEWIPKPGAKEGIYGRLSDVTVSMSLDELKSLPPVTYIDKAVTLSEEEKRKYQELKREYITDIEGEEVTATNAAVLSGKLRQLSGGAVYDADHNVRVLHDAKIETLKEMAEYADGNILVAYNYKHDLTRIKEAIPEAIELKSAESIKAWNAGRVRIALGHPASMGHGLNIQSGGHIIVWFSLTWNLEEYLQFNARLHRQGQTHPVTVYHLMTAGTIDNRIAKLLKQKEITQQDLIDAVKAEL